MNKKQLNFKKDILIPVVIAIILVFAMQNIKNDTYIIRLIGIIDKTEKIEVYKGGKMIESYDFETVIPQFVYGNILDVKKPWNYFFNDYKEKYFPTDYEVYYLKGDKILGKAKVFNQNDKHVFFMKNVFWTAKESFIKQ